MYALVQSTLIGMLGTRRALVRCWQTFRIGSYGDAGLQFQSLHRATTWQARLAADRAVPDRNVRLAFRALYIGAICLLTMLPLTYAMRRAPPHVAADASPTSIVRVQRVTQISPFALQTLLMIAGVGCCVAMSMPQVHIVAYCADLGYGRLLARRCCRSCLPLASSAALHPASLPTHRWPRTFCSGPRCRACSVLHPVLTGCRRCFRLGPVWIVSGRNRAELRDYRA